MMLIAWLKDLVHSLRGRDRSRLVRLGGWLCVVLLFWLVLHASVHWHPSDGEENGCPVCSIARLGTLDKPAAILAGALLLCAALISQPLRNDRQPAVDNIFLPSAPRSPPR